MQYPASGSWSGRLRVLEPLLELPAMPRLILSLLFLLLPLSTLAVTAELKLHEFLPFPSLELRCVADEQAMEIPIPERWKINGARLRLHYKVSNALISRISNMVVKLNGRPVAQTRLMPVAEDEPFEVTLPPELFEAGYNKLAFSVSQHYTEKECEQPCASSLWTSIKLQSSTLLLNYEMRPVPLQLGSIASFTFDPKLFVKNSVHLAFQTADEQQASLAATVASGVARRFDYRKVTFTVGDTLKPGKDNIIVGTEAFVRQLLGEKAPAFGADKGGYLKILRMPAIADAPADDRHALIIASGATVDEVKLAVETLATLSIAYPGSDELKATGFNLPDVTSYSGRSIISADKVYDFDTLGLPTRTMAGMNPQALRINFRLPADFLVKQNRTVEMALNFAYGAGMRNDSALNVIVNDIAVRAIPLQNTEGGFFENYKLEIPTYVFRAGDNNITLQPELHITAKECDLLQPGNLFLTIYGNSTFRFPFMPHFVEMPRLELFMLNGFPFTRWPDGFEGTIYLARPTIDSLAAAMNVVGLMTQRNGFPLVSLSLTYKPPTAAAGELIVLGDIFSLPPELAAASPLKVGKTSTVPYPIVRNWQNESSFAFSDQLSRMGEQRGLLMEFESPQQPGRSVLLLAAQEQRDLVRLSEHLLEPQVQGQINGALALIEFSGAMPKVTSFSVGKTYTTGKQGDIDWFDAELDRLTSLMYGKKWLFYGLLVFSLVTLTVLMVTLIRRYRARRLKTVAGKTKN